MPEMKTIRNWISLSREIAQTREKQAKKAMDILGNDLNVALPGGGASVEIAPNHVMAAVRGYIPSIYFSDPYIRAIPQHEDQEPMARGIEAVDTFYWRECRAKATMRRAILDTFGYGFACVKVGLDKTTTGDDEREEIREEMELLSQGIPVPAEEDQDHALHISLKEEILEDTTLPGEAIEVLQDNINGHKEFGARPDHALTAGRDKTDNWLHFHNVTRNVFWELNVLNPLESAFIVHRHLERIRDVKADPFYKNTKDLKGSAFDPVTKKLAKRLGSEAEILEDLGYIYIYDIWDAETRTVSTAVEDRDAGLLRDEDPSPWPDQVESYPFRFLTLMDGFEAPHGAPLIDYMEWPQKLISRLYQQMMHHTQTSGEHWMAQKSGFDEDVEEVETKFKSGDTKQLYWVHDAQMPPFQKMPMDQFDPSVFQALALAEKALTVNAGAPMEAQAIGGANSATSASLLGSTFNNLLRDNIGIFEDFQGELINVMNGHLEAFGPDEKTILAATPNFRGWVDYVATDLAGGWNIVVKMIPPPNDNDKMDLLNWYGIVKDDLTEKQKQYVLQEMARQRGFDQDQFHQGEDPIELELIQYENNELAQGKAVAVNPKHNHHLHAKYHQADMQELQKAAQGLQQAPPEDPRVADHMQIIATALEAFGAHMQEHAPYLGPGQQIKRVRNQVPFPTNNTPGRVQRIIAPQGETDGS